MMRILILNVIIYDGEYNRGSLSVHFLICEVVLYVRVTFIMMTIQGEREYPQILVILMSGQ